VCVCVGVWLRERKSKIESARKRSSHTLLLSHSLWWLELMSSLCQVSKNKLSGFDTLIHARTLTHAHRHTRKCAHAHRGESSLDKDEEKLSWYHNFLPLLSLSPFRSPSHFTLSHSFSITCSANLLIQYSCLFSKCHTAFCRILLDQKVSYLNYLVFPIHPESLTFDITFSFLMLYFITLFYFLWMSIDGCHWLNAMRIVRLWFAMWQWVQGAPKTRSLKVYKVTQWAINLGDDYCYSVSSWLYIGYHWLDRKQ